MSVLPADVHAQLTQLLQALQSPDNAVRSQAEEHLAVNWTASRPEVLLMGLAEQVQGAESNAVRRWPYVENMGYANIVWPIDPLIRCCHLPTYRFQNQKDGCR